MPMKSREIAAVVMLAVTAGLAVVAVLLHYAFMAEYGDVNMTGLQRLIWGLTAGLAPVAAVPVVVTAVIAFILTTVRSKRITAIAIPVTMLLGMIVVTPLT